MLETPHVFTSSIARIINPLHVSVSLTKKFIHIKLNLFKKSLMLTLTIGQNFVKYDELMLESKSSKSMSRCSVSMEMSIGVIAFKN